MSGLSSSSRRITCATWAFFLTALMCLGYARPGLAQEEKVDYPSAKAAFSKHKRARPANTTPDRVVIHSTFDKSVKRDNFFNKDAILKIWDDFGVSTHYFIERDGTVWQLVKENAVAYHDPRYNNRSIGVELAGISDEFKKDAEKQGAQTADYEYAQKQYDALNALVEHLVKRYPKVAAIRHSDIYEKRLTVTADPAKLRKGPKAGSEEVSTVPKGTVLVTHVTREGFNRVEHKGVDGWIAEGDAEAKWVKRKGDPGEKFDEAKVKGIAFVTDHGN